MTGIDIGHSLVFADHLEELYHLADEIFALHPDPLDLHLPDEPIWESMLTWFGDPRFDTLRG